MTTDKIPFINGNKQYKMVDAKHFEAFPQYGELLNDYKFLQECYETNRQKILKIDEILLPQIKSLQEENLNLRHSLRVSEQSLLIVCVLLLATIAFYTLRG